MKIRRLEIQGFKSFADRTVLKFGDGITGVVGPNGCGKSNIVDAIRWVMGEQSAKHLRGAGMQDVIFAGCEARGPAGMSEVSITFKNDGALVPPEYEHLDEIQVTRRLYRDGTSEYAINKVTCRLRDILDLFMGTGIGKNAYAIIEQGRIGMIVTARPEERRALIEDAAGVSRYKARRKQAERRIAATEQNLLRVADLVGELEGRLGTLEKQAKKAERYKRLKTELRDLDLHTAAHKRLELDAVELFESRSSGGLRLEVEEERQRVETEETAIAEELDALAVQESDLRQKEAAAYESRKALDLAKQNVEFLLREDAKLLERIEEAEVEQAELQTEQASLHTERSDAETQASSLQEGAGEEQRMLGAREVALGALGEQIGEARANLDKRKAEMVESLTASAQRKNALENLARRASDLEARATSAQENAEGSRKKAEDTKKRVTQLESELSRSRQMKLHLEEEQGSHESTLAELRQEAKELEAQLGKTRDQLVDRRSRFKSLEQIRANYEGCSDAVRAVMAQDEVGLHGLVADVLTSEARYETAVEAVLGDRLQSVVVAEQDDGYAAGRLLKKGGQGRSTFVPMDLRLDHAPWAPKILSVDRLSSLPPIDAESGPDGYLAGGDASASLSAGPYPQAEPPTPINGFGPEGTALPAPLDESMPPSPSEEALAPWPGHPPQWIDPDEAIVSDLADWLEEEESQWPDLTDPSVCGKMVDLVQAKPGYEHVAQALLGDVVVVESLDKAHELWVANGHRKTLVTLEGDVLDPMGLFTGGSSAGVSEGLLAQKREMGELQAEVTALETKLADAQQTKGELRSKVERLEARVKALSSEGQQGALAIVSMERDLAGLRNEIARDGELSQRAEEEATRLRRDLAALSQERQATQEALEQLELTKQDSERRVSESAQALEDLERQGRDLSDEITTLKVGVASNREKRESAHKNVQRIQARLDDIDVRLDKLTGVVQRSRVDRKAAEARAGTERERIRSLEEIVARERESLDALKERLDRERETVKSRESQVKGLRDGLEGLRAQLNKKELRLRELQIARENLESQIQERYRVNLTELLTDFHVLAPPTDEHLKTTKRLRRQLNDIGAINLTAIDEYASVKARYDHLASQKLDLEQATEALRSAIRKINKTSKERFVEAFHLVNEKFQQVFPKVFSGGRCALVLTDEDDPLESGVEIMAQPPGKKLQSVNLLSGGEKALTAVSLIFGIFLIKPTPFCLLDEVDAPLDEANVGRYNDMLKEMSGISQFILITHNKRTMEMPDRLYGVTMETPGISKIVPVDVMADDRQKPDLRVV